MRIPWSKYETALLIDLYIKIRSGAVDRTIGVVGLSRVLRESAKSSGIDVDVTYRNDNGINMRLYEIEYLFNGRKGGLKNTSNLFVEMVEMYNNNRDEFNSILDEAKARINGKKREIQFLNNQEYQDLIMSISMKNSVFASTIMQLLSKYPVLSNEDLLMLTDKKKCSELFKADFPMLKEVDINSDLRSQLIDGNNRSRYYGATYEINGKHYVITSELYGLSPKQTHRDNRTLFYDWVLSKLEAYDNKVTKSSQKDKSEEKVKDKQTYATSDLKDEYFNRVTSGKSPTEKYLYKYAFSALEKYCVTHGIINKSLFEVDTLEKFKQLKVSIFSDMKFKRRNSTNWHYICQTFDLFEKFCKDKGIMRSEPSESAPVESPISVSNNNTNLYAGNHTSNRVAISVDDTVVNYFIKLWDEYPELVFTNHDATNKVQRRCAYIYPKDTPRKGNVIFEVWLETKRSVFTLFAKRQYLSEDENKMADANIGNGSNNTRGKIELRFTYRDEFVAYFKDKLDLIQQDLKAVASEKPTTVSPNTETTSEEKKEQAEFFYWLSHNEGLLAPTCRAYISGISSSEKYAKEHGFKPAAIFTGDKEDAKNTVFALLKDSAFVSSHVAYVSMLKRFLQYVGVSNPSVVSVAPKKPVPPKADPRIVESIEEFVKERTEGVTKAKLFEAYSYEPEKQVKNALEVADVIPVLDKLYHKDNIEDFDYMADTMLEVLNHQFDVYGNYSSMHLLYKEIHPRLDDFFFFNSAFESKYEVYDLARYLFEKKSYKDNSFIFANSFHIWKETPDYSMDFCGLLKHYCRSHNNVFSRSEAESYLEELGAGTPAQTLSNIINKAGWNTFLQYDENRFVLCDAIGINDDFLAKIRNQIDIMLEDEYYTAFGDLNDYFYSTLPALPDGVNWGPLLLESILIRKDLGFLVVYAGEKDMKTVPAALAKKNSVFKTFADIVWNEMSNDFQLPKKFSFDEFRKYLLSKEFIHGTEKLYTAHKTVEGDLRFLWADNNTSVTVSNA